MDNLFISILNLSLTGTYVITAILLARLLLKKSPKALSYCLWAVAGIRLTLPFSIDSIWSPVPFGAQPIAVDTIATVISD
ncbi:MAG: M56 family metallopeptidase, partial [Defluviitaleaceae bacterium]|nr:M56 family metallopeptidase [Defluviitaleaceae bacterium]